MTLTSCAHAVSTPETNTENKPLEEFTHTVFAEEGTATWCPNCPIAAEALYSIYQSNDYPFYYVALVHDKNELAKDRLLDYVINLYKLIAFPTVYFDGGDQNMVGRGSSVPETEAMYRDIIETVGTRAVRQPIHLETAVSWLGNAKIKVTVNVTNDGNFFYFGKLRSYVTEIESRWNDNNGNPYHFGFLDFAINKFILLFPGKTKTFSVEWDGAADHGGQTYEDITEDNIMVISTISHWIPHYRTGYESEDYLQKYFAFYIDQTSAGTP
jgi:thiol-disulfide isomerase/thioredoxin